MKKNSKHKKLKIMADTNIAYFPHDPENDIIGDIGEETLNDTIANIAANSGGRYTVEENSSNEKYLQRLIETGEENNLPTATVNVGLPTSGILDPVSFTPPTQPFKPW